MIKEIKDEFGNVYALATAQKIGKPKNDDDDDKEEDNKKTQKPEK